jgi:KDO2-lipid IV(A) lauroyltransferase
MKVSRRIKDKIETILVRGAMGLFWILPLDAASWMGGKLGQWVGPMTGIHRKARRQMFDILRDASSRDIDVYLAGMWNNLGRVMAEYPHLPRIMRDRLVLDNQSGKTIEEIQNGAAIFIGGHFANWEVAGPAMLYFTGQKLDLVYRAPNNAGVDAVLGGYRSMNGALEMIAKSTGGARAIVERLKAGRKIGILIDQKYTQGIVADFFGRPATATTIYAQLGQRFRCPVYPAQVVRTGGARFKVVLYPPLRLFDDEGAARALPDVVADAHALMFGWMRQHPDQWLWVHQRWSSAKAMAHAAREDGA